MVGEGRQVTPPAPEGLGTAAQFALALKALKAWSGLSYREIEARARAAGLSLPFSTASGMLGRATLPREDLLIAFTTACGLDETEVAAWVTARKTLAVTAMAATTATPQATASDTDAATPAHPRRMRLRRRLALATCAAFVAAALVATGALAAQGQIAHEVDVTTSDTTAPATPSRQMGSPAR